MKSTTMSMQSHNSNIWLTTCLFAEHYNHKSQRITLSLFSASPDKSCGAKVLYRLREKVKSAGKDRHRDRTYEAWDPHRCVCQKTRFTVYGNEGMAYMVSWHKLIRGGGGWAIIDFLYSMKIFYFDIIWLLHLSKPFIAQYGDPKGRQDIRTSLICDYLSLDFNTCL